MEFSASQILDRINLIVILSYFYFTKKLLYLKNFEN